MGTVRKFEFFEIWFLLFIIVWEFRFFEIIWIFKKIIGVFYSCIFFINKIFCEFINNFIKKNVQKIYLFPNSWIKKHFFYL